MGHHRLRLGVPAKRSTSTLSTHTYKSDPSRLRNHFPPKPTVILCVSGSTDRLYIRDML